MCIYGNIGCGLLKSPTTYYNPWIMIITAIIIELRCGVRTGCTIRGIRYIISICNSSDTTSPERWPLYTTTNLQIYILLYFTVISTIINILLLYQLLCSVIVWLYNINQKVGTYIVCIHYIDDGRERERERET